MNSKKPINLRKTIKENNIKKEAQIIIIPKLRGGMNEDSKKRSKK